MGFFTETRLHFGNSILLKKASKLVRKPYYRNFSGIRNIGIVWDASKTNQFASLSKFRQKMSERNIDVNILGYYSGKELPDEYTAIRYLTCFRKKEVNLFYIPESPEVNKFVNKSFSILIDINFDKLFPLTCIAVLSRAAFKVGLLDQENDVHTFDLMMELKKPVNVDDYLTHVINYLEMINAESAVHTVTL